MTLKSCTIYFSLFQELFLQEILRTLSKKWVIFFLQLTFFAFYRTLVLKSSNFYKTCPFFVKLLFLIHSHFNPVTSLNPDEDGIFISVSTKYELHPRSLQKPWKQFPDLVCLKSLGHWLTLVEGGYNWAILTKI